MLMKNAIVLIDETDCQIPDDDARMAVVVVAVGPVSLDALTTVWRAVPRLWDPFFASLAVVINCRLSFATILT